MQLDQEDRGFSFTKEGPLDMRMDRSEALSAKEVVNTYSEKELGRIFREYGEERNWKRAAHAVVEARRKKPIETTKELSEIIAASAHRKKKLHPATLVFQALRIFVNRELEAIQEGVSKAIKMLASGGLIGTLAFHRLEDRIVKNIFRDASKPLKKIEGMKETTFMPMLKLVTKSPLTPTRLEQRKNPRARSAKLRFAEKL